MKPGDVVQTTQTMQRWQEIPEGTRITITKVFQVDRGRWLFTGTAEDGTVIMNFTEQVCEVVQ